jgi:hypothetical protein
MHAHAGAIRWPMSDDYHLRRAQEIRERGAQCRDPKERALYEEFAQLHEARAWHVPAGDGSCRTP